MAFRIYKQWGTHSYDTVEKILIVFAMPGFAFEKADNLAIQMGFDEESLERIRTALAFILMHNLYNNGHTFLQRRSLYRLPPSFYQSEQKQQKQRLKSKYPRESLFLLRK